MQGWEATGPSRDRADRQELSKDLNGVHSRTLSMLLLVLVVHKRDPDFRLIDQGSLSQGVQFYSYFKHRVVCLINANHCYEA